MKRKVKRFREADKVKKQIYKVFPHAKDVNIKVRKIPDKGYKSFIQVTLPTKKRLIALKRGYSPKLSLERSYKAIVRQVHKVKNKMGSTQQRKRKK